MSPQPQAATPQPRVQPQSSSVSTPRGRGRPGAPRQERRRRRRRRGRAVRRDRRQAPQGRADHPPRPPPRPDRAKPCESYLGRALGFRPGSHRRFPLRLAPPPRSPESRSGGQRWARSGDQRRVARAKGKSATPSRAHQAARGEGGGCAHAESRDARPAPAAPQLSLPVGRACRVSSACPSGARVARGTRAWNCR